MAWCSGFFIVLLAWSSSTVPAGAVLITVDTTARITRVPSSFLSVTIDAGAIASNFKGFSFTEPRVVNMARGLSPAVVRVGGTSEDRITYVANGGPLRSSEKRPLEAMDEMLDRLAARMPLAEGFTMNYSQWDAINSFARSVGWNLTFGLNAQQRTKGGQWNMTNAEMLIRYTEKRGYHVNWELGNGESHLTNINFASI